VYRQVSSLLQSIVPLIVMDVALTPLLKGGQVQIGPLFRRCPRRAGDPLGGRPESNRSILNQAAGGRDGTFDVLVKVGRVKILSLVAPSARNPERLV